MYTSKIELINLKSIIRVKQRIYTYQDIPKFDKQIKELLEKNLIQNSTNPHTIPAFVVRRKKRQGKNGYKLLEKINENTFFMVITFQKKQFYLMEYKVPLSSLRQTIKQLLAN